MEKHIVSDIGQKGITRLVSRFQRDFSSDQTPGSLILQAEKVRDLTLSLMTVASKSPDRLGVFLSVISGMGDIGVIHNMDTAVEETMRLMHLLPVDVGSRPAIPLPVATPAVATSIPGSRAANKPEKAASKMDQHLFDDAARFTTSKAEDTEAILPQQDQPRIPKAEPKVSARLAEEKKRYGETFVPGMSTTIPEKPGQWIAPKERPKADIGLSVSEDSITCLHCGGEFTMIKRHIERQHRQTPEDYRAYWGLPPEYPMAATNYTLLKREEAKGTGLGTYNRKKSSRKKESVN
ncbi:MucR family transcriptional regulator [Acetobacter persici]|nr:MucR family transcriptional regulator [Acetobacter persici]